MKLRDLGERIEGPGDIPSGDTSKARAVLAAFDEQIDSLRSTIMAFEDAFLRGETSEPPGIGQAENGYFSLACGLNHERIHATQSKKRLIEAVEYVSSKNSECVPDNISAAEIRTRTIGIIIRIENRSRLVQDNMHNFNELEAYRVQLGSLVKIRNRIADQRL